MEHRRLLSVGCLFVCFKYSKITAYSNLIKCPTASRYWKGSFALV